MSKITDLQRAVDNNSRNCGTTAKKVRALIKASIQELVEKAINDALAEKSTMTAAQQSKLVLDLIKLGVDVEKIVDEIKTQEVLKKIGKDQGEDSATDTATVLPYIKTSRK